MGKFFSYILLIFIFSVNSVFADRTFTQDCGSKDSIRVVGDQVQIKNKKSDFIWKDSVNMYLITWNEKGIVFGYDKSAEVDGIFYNRLRVNTAYGSSKKYGLMWHSATDEELKVSFGWCDTHFLKIKS